MSGKSLHSIGALSHRSLRISKVSAPLHPYFNELEPDGDECDESSCIRPNSNIGESNAGFI